MRFLALSLGLVAVFAERSAAAPIVAGSTTVPAVAIQDITLLPNTSFNPTNSAILLRDISGVGTLTFNRNAQSGSTIILSSLAGGQFYGSNPALGNYVFGNVGTLTGADFSGAITNVVQNPADPGFATGQPSSFQSGNFSFGGNSFGFQFLTGPAAGIILYTDPSVPFQFSATFNGLPPSVGTVLQNSGPNFLNVNFNGVPVATSSNRRIIVTPEPASLAVLAFLAVGTGASRLTRRRAKLVAV